MFDRGSAAESPYKLAPGCCPAWHGLARRRTALIKVPVAKFVDSVDEI
jgi:hypothetical protein